MQGSLQGFARWVSNTARKPDIRRGTQQEDDPRMPEKTAKPAANRARSTRSTSRTTTRKTKATPRVPDHSDIATRAYYIHLEAGSCDEVGNWLQAERELMAA